MKFYKIIVYGFKVENKVQIVLTALAEFIWFLSIGNGCSENFSFVGYFLNDKVFEQKRNVKNQHRDS